MENTDKKCKCGCGQIIIEKPFHKYHGIPDYIQGHTRIGKKMPNPPWNKGIKCSEETKQKIRDKVKGRSQPPEQIAKRLATINERDPDGRRYEKAKTTRAINLKSGVVVQAPSWVKGKKRPPEFGAIIKKKAIERHFTNGMRPEICRMYVNEGMTARKIGDKLGTTRDVVTKRLKEEGVSIRKLGDYRKGMEVSRETRAKLSKATKDTFQKPEFLERYRKAINIKPNRPEMFLINLLNELYPGQWKYTGDFSMTINGKCPDFVNVNGQKKIIELFGDYWHKGENPQNRADIFKPFGYETLVIWESELKHKESVKNRIERFCVHESQ